jgi:hypothetical protein
MIGSPDPLYALHSYLNELTLALDAIPPGRPLRRTADQLCASGRLNPRGGGGASHIVHI